MLDKVLVIITRRTTCNIYKLLRNIVVGDVTLVEYDNDTTKCWHMCLDHLNECGLMEFHKRNLLKGVYI